MVTLRSTTTTLALLLIVTLASCAAPAATGPELPATEPLPTSVPAGTKIVVGDPGHREGAASSPAQVDKLTVRCRVGQHLAAAADHRGVPGRGARRRLGRRDPADPRDLDRSRRQDHRLQVPAGPAQPPDLRARHRPRVRVQSAVGPAGQEDRLQPRARPRARWSCKVLQTGRADQGGRQAGRAAQHRRRVHQRAGQQAGRRRPARRGGRSSATWPSTARTGRTTIQHGLRDDPSHLYVLKSSLERPGQGGRAARVRAAWGVGRTRWIDEHPEEWIAAATT